MKHIVVLISLISFNCYSASVNELIQKGQEALHQKKKDEAIRYLTQALSTYYEHSEALFYLGIVYYYANEGNKALPLLKKCYERDPSNTRYTYAYMLTANQIGEFKLARDLFEKHYGSEPKDGDLRTKLLPLYIRDRDWYYAAKLCSVDDLWWYNQDINHKKIVLDLSSEWNGRGDVMQILRYAKHLHTAGAYVTAYVRHELVPLLSLCPYLAFIVSTQQPKPEGDLTYSVTTDRIFLRMKDKAHTPSEDVPYLYADSKLCKKWQTLLATDTQFKVGICFQSTKMRDFFSDTTIPGPRAFYAEQLTPLFSVPDMSFYSLQAGEAGQVAQLRRFDNFHAFDHLDAQTGAFMDTAALMKQLDLVITVDTAIAHLAGALGVPVWVMQPRAGDFRWFSNCDDCPWYPTMKLFRQDVHGDWDGLIQKVKGELEKLK